MSKKQPNPIDKHVGSRVRMRRMMLSMSQEKLGDELDLTFQQVQKYEKGTNRIGASRLQQIAAALDVPVSYFFEGAPGGGRGARSVTPDYVARFVTSSDGLTLARCFDKIESPIVRRSLVNLVERMAEAS